MKIKFSYYKSYPIQSPLGRFIAGFFLLVGLATCVLSIFFFREYGQVKDELVKVNAVIERIDVRSRGDDRDYDVYVSYYYGGKTYDGIHLNYYNSGMDEGDRMVLTIHPDHPGEVVQNNGPLVLIIGIVFTLVGGGFSAAAWWDKLKGRFAPGEEILR